MTTMNIPELCEAIVTTFKSIANFNERFYITDEVNAGKPEQDLANELDYLDRLLEAHDTIEIFPAETRKDLENLFFVGDIKSSGIDNALSEYAHGRIPTFNP